jgi:hypothetical protein
MGGRIMSIRRGFPVILTAMGALLWLQPPASAADHRDAPTIDLYSALDINDTYLFHDGGNLVVIVTTHALSEPKFGATYHYQPNGLYRINFSTNPAAVPTATIDFIFSEFANGPTCPAPKPACQTFTATFPNNIVVNGTVTQGSSTGSPPAAIINGPDNNGITIFAGPREDPFVFDGDGFNRFVAKFNSTGTADLNQFSGDDAFAGNNTNAIVIELPISLVAGTATKFATWSITYLRLNTNENVAERFVRENLGGPTGGLLGPSPDLQQVDREGNPAVNTALIPPPLKDAFNFGIPENDPRDFAPVILQTLKKFGTSAVNTNILASVAVPDTLKFDLSQPDGFPNGRRLQDRVIDILLALILNLDLNNLYTNFPEGVDRTRSKQAAKNYLSTFPFAGPPLAQ